MKYMKIIAFLLPVILFSGCWDRKELEEQAYVVVIGVDKGKGGQFLITYQIASTESGVSFKAGGQPKEPSEIVTLSSPDFVVARELATASVTRKISFIHTRMLIVSESIARSDDFVNVVGPSLRDVQIRRNMYIVVTRENAENFIRNNQPKLEVAPHKFYDYMTRRWKETGYVPIATLNDYMQRIQNNEDLFLSVYASSIQRSINKYGYETGYLPGELYMTGGNPVQIMGSAVFKEGKMIGSLTGDETRLALMLRPYSKADNLIFSLPDPMKGPSRMAARIVREKNAKINIDTKGANPVVNVDIPLSVHMISLASPADDVKNDKSQEILKKSIEDYLKERSIALVKRCQSEFKQDPFMWSLVIRKKSLTIEQYENYKWKDKFPEAEVNINFNVKIKSFGKLLESTKTSKDKGM